MRVLTLQLFSQPLTNGTSNSHVDVAWYGANDDGRPEARGAGPSWPCFQAPTTTPGSEATAAGWWHGIIGGSEVK